MVCKLCDTTNPQDARFCLTCGADLSQEEVSPDVSDPSPVAKALKWLIPAACVVIILIFALARLFSGGGGGVRYEKIEHSYYFAYIPDDDETFVIADGRKLETPIDGHASSAGYSDDRSAILVRNSNYELYHISGGKITEITDEYSGSCAISANGKAVVFTEDDYTLYLWQLGSGKPKKVEKDVYMFVISPDGKTIAFVDDNAGLYIYTGEKPSKLDNRVSSIRSVSNSGQYIYYVKNGSIYCTSAKEEKGVKLKSDFDLFISSGVDRTGALFVSDNELCYSDKGREPQESGIPVSTYIFPMTPRFSTVSSGAFTGHVFRNSDGGIYYVDKNGDSARIVKSTDLSYMTDNAKTIFYLKSGSIYRAPADGSATGEKIVSDVYTFLPSSDGKFIYYIDEDDELYVIEGSKKAVHLADEVVSMRISYDGFLFFINEDDELFYSQGGKTPVEADYDVISFECQSTATFYTTDSGDLYMSTGGAKFELLLEDVG